MHSYQQHIPHHVGVTAVPRTVHCPINTCVVVVLWRFLVADQVLMVTDGLPNEPQSPAGNFLQKVAAF